jgi:hypothetical protein
MKSEKAPHFTGKLVIKRDYKAGDTIQLGAWQRTNANGTLITLSEDTYRFDQQQQRAAQYPKEVNTREFDDEDVPF